MVQAVPPPRVVEASSGLPAGDPCSPHFLACVLAPWTNLVEMLPGVKPFAYMDDRSLTDADFSLPRALQLTSWSDPRLGLVEHMGKRHEWCRACSELLCDLARAVGGLPGSMETRERLLSLVLPKITWASPLLPQVPDSVVKAFFLACRSSCSWWCKGRVWADHITFHPQYATAIKRLTAASRQVARTCPVLTAAIKHHADILEMEVQSTSRGLWLRPKPGAPQTVLDAVRKRRPGRALPRFEAAADEGHTLRMVARALALQAINAEREDSEGSHAIDLEAQSHPTWVCRGAACGAFRSLLSSTSGVGELSRPRLGDGMGRTL